MGSTNVYKLTSADLRAFLNKEAKYYKDVLIEAELAATVQATLWMKMFVKSSMGRLKLIFMEYHWLLRTNGIKFVVTKTPKMPIRHVLSVNWH